MKDLWVLQWGPFKNNGNYGFHIGTLADFLEDGQALFGETYITKIVDVQKIWIPLVIGTFEQCAKSLNSLEEKGADRV